MKVEIWKPIWGFPDYEISSFGNVRSWKPANQYSPKPKTPKLLSLVFNKKRGYVYCNLRNLEGRRCFVSVHRMVAFAFIPNEYSFPEVNHKDKNRLNNHVENLEWCTEEQNSIHANGKSMVVVSPEGEIFYSEGINKLSRITGLDSAALVRLNRGEYKHTQGWVLYGCEEL